MKAGCLGKREGEGEAEGEEGVIEDGVDRVEIVGGAGEMERSMKKPCERVFICSQKIDDVFARIKWFICAQI